MSVGWIILFARVMFFWTIISFVFLGFWAPLVDGHKDRFSFIGLIFGYIIGFPGMLIIYSIYYLPKLFYKDKK